MLPVLKVSGSAPAEYVHTEGVEVVKTTGSPLEAEHVIGTVGGVKWLYQ